MTPRHRASFRAPTTVRAVFVAALVVLVAACGASLPGSTPAASVVAPSAPVASGPAPSSGPATSDPGASPASAARPVVIDTDLAADDILAIMVLLRDPSVDVRAIAVDGTGEVRCAAGVRNARRLVAAFRRSDVRVACGRENPGPAGRWFPGEWRDAADAFYGVKLPEVDGESARTGERAPAILARVATEVKAAGTPLTVVALGPWTNLADALTEDPAFASNLAGIHAMGGTIDAPGNVDTGTTSPADQVEWNLGVDPDAVAAVLATDVPVTTVGLDATKDVPVPADIEQVLGTDTRSAGADVAHELYQRNPALAHDTSFWDTLAAVLVSEPSIAGWEDVPVRLETAGPSAGRIARDASGRIVHAATGADRTRFMTALLAALRTGAPAPDRETIAGTLEARWDGRTCHVESAPTEAGDIEVKLVNGSDAPVGLVMAGVAAPQTWAEALQWVRKADLGDANLVPPAWIVPVALDLQAEPGRSASSVVTLGPGTYGAACGTGEWPAIEMHDGAAFTAR